MITVGDVRKKFGADTFVFDTTVDEMLHSDDSKLEGAEIFLKKVDDKDLKILELKGIVKEWIEWKEEQIRRYGRYTGKKMDFLLERSRELIK